jgi:LCP family protein required for cell wall assembly
MTDHETLIREALTEEAGRAVDPGVLLDALRQGSRPRRRPVMMVAAAGVAVVVAVLAVIVPLSLSRGGDQESTVAAQSVSERNILLIGLDGSSYADSVVLVRFGADNVLRGVSLPRDSWVDVPGRGMSRLALAYSDAHNRAAVRGGDAAAEGAKALAAAVEGLTGQRVDHYAAVDMAAFGRLSAAIGGVEVCLRAPSQDPLSGADFGAGKQLVSGPSALAFVRQRRGLPSGDLDRILRQHAFLGAVTDKMAGLTDPAALIAVLDSIRVDVNVDKGWDLVDAVRELRQGGKVRLATIPVADESMTAPDATTVVGVDPAAVRAFVAGFLAGTPVPAPGGEQNPRGPGEDTCVN